MNFHARLVDATRSERDRLERLPVIRRALAGDISRAEYAGFLGEAYHHVRHTVPLLMACGARLPARAEWLREAVAHYIDEEIGHQEWILDDLEAMGEDRGHWASRRPNLATELMVAYAWDGVQRGNPMSFFGMVMVLAGTSVALATRAAESVERALGLPRSAFTYLRSHGDLDQEHVGFFEGLMDRVDDPADQQAIEHAARAFYRLYADVFRSIERPRQAAEAAS